MLRPGIRSLLLIALGNFTILSTDVAGQSPVVIPSGHLNDVTQRLREWRTDPRLKKYTENVKGIDEFLQTPKLPVTRGSDNLASAFGKDNQPNNTKLEEAIKAIEVVILNTKVYPLQIRQLQDMVDSRIQAFVGENPNELKETRAAIRLALATIATAEGTYLKEKAIEKLTAIAGELKGIRQ